MTFSFKSLAHMAILNLKKEELKPQNREIPNTKFQFLNTALLSLNFYKSYKETMNILLLGSGGREHALSWKISQSRHCTQLYIAPGNAGTAQFGINLPFTVNDFDAIQKSCSDHNIDMVIVGPEEPLVNGVVDFLKTSNEKLLIVGPSREAAQLEGSKAFAKAF